MAIPKEYGIASDLEADIALLKLESNLNLDYQSTGLAPVCIPTVSEPLDSKAGKKCTLMGWGATKKDHSHIADHLMKVKVKIWKQKKCIKAWAKESKITDFMLCAGEKGKGICDGDSGGPLVCSIKDRKKKKRFYQYGVASFGKMNAPCASKRFPSVFARVSTLSEWIVKVIQKYQ